MAGRPEEAHALSERLTHLIGELMEIVGNLTDGNRFANAGKAADHFLPTARRPRKSPRRGFTRGVLFRWKRSGRLLKP